MVRALNSHQFGLGSGLATVGHTWVRDRSLFITGEGGGVEDFRGIT